MARLMAMQASHVIHQLRASLALSASRRVALPTVAAVHQKASLATMDGPAQPQEVQDAAPLPKVQVRIPPEDAASITISLIAAGKQRNLNRPKDEPLQKALFRLRNSIQPPSNNKKKKQKGPSTPATAGVVANGDSELVTTLYRDLAASQVIPEDTANDVAWSAAQLLVVGSERFQVQVNAPFVEQVTLPRRPMAGFPMLASATLQFADAGLTRWEWARRQQGSTEWVVVGHTDLYTPTAQDVGCTLRCTVTAGIHKHAGSGTSHGADAVSWGEPVEVMSDVVEAAPAVDSAGLRCETTHDRPVTGPGFRILSYNLLADQYAGSTYAQTVLFNYCPPRCLDPDYRCQLILKELLGYSADVMCLQEVDARLFRDFLTPHLQRHGYEGHFTNKQGKVREGSATFWRTSRLRRLLSADILLRDVFKQPLSAAHSQWQPMLDASPELVRALQKVTTIAQLCLLTPVQEGGNDNTSASTPPLCVINTHLFYHPYAPHIRTMHTAAILEEAAALLNELQTAQPPQSSLEPVADGCVLLSNGEVVGCHGQGPASAEWQSQVAAALGGHKPTLLFCGDLNSDLNDGVPGVVELLQAGRLTADHWDWRMGANFKWGMNEEDGDPEQQAGAPQPPGSAIAAAVAAAKVATASAQSSRPSDTTGQQADTASQSASQPTTAVVQAEEPSASDSCSISVIGIDVQCPFKLSSADDLKIPFTNYTSGYKALLDYVWYQPERLKVTQVHPVPNEEQLGSFIPSPVFPSDHLAVVFDLEPATQQ